MMRKSLLITVILCWMFTSNAVSNVNRMGTICGTGTSGITGDGGKATSATMNGPRSVWRDSTDNIFIADSGGKCVRKVSVSDGIVNLYAGTHSGGYSGDGGAATSATVATVIQMKADTIGQVFFNDYGNNRIRIVSASGIISTFVGGCSGNVGTATPVTSMCLNGPQGMWVNTVGDFYYTEDGGNAVKYIDPTSSIVSVYAGRVGSSSYFGDGGPATSATFGGLEHLFQDSLGNVYVSDAGASRVRQVSFSSKIINTVIGNGGTTYVDNAPGTSTGIAYNTGIAGDSSNGDLYTTARNGNFIFALATATGRVVSYAGTGTAGFGGDDGPASSAQLNGPDGMAMFDGQNNLYIADRYSNKIRSAYMIVPTGIPTNRPTSPTVLPSPAPCKRPTVFPSLRPTIAPSLIPSCIPSMSPSVVPTVAPSLIPSIMPSMSPSLQPSIVPSIAPTIIPSLTPSILPSTSPSLSPSMIPSILPTLLPSIVPSVLPTTTQPTLSPSMVPSISPSMVPSMAPSCSPSVKPSISPSTTPSLLPSIIPSIVPTVIPTLTPSFIPTITPTLFPSIAPTISPTFTPSLTPSLMPSFTPTVCPSINPTMAPSLSPSVKPSIVPTIFPSTTPSVSPSLFPSFSPTIRPSLTPSCCPSVTPTIEPTTPPSVAPSFFPSIHPSQAPSVAPSISPSIVPSIIPSTVPSQGPSLSPSIEPSTAPSVDPSITPSITPSVEPSIAPTHLPSIIPTELPSIAPTRLPSILPSTNPSVEPSVHPSISPSVAPSVEPSFEPTVEPSVDPSIAPSIHPSFEPSLSPSIMPSCLPTLNPSVDPSSEPSIVPSMEPTMIPSYLPTEIPSVSPSQHPSSDPSITPSVHPSVSPTVNPTENPSVEPSLKPSISPSLVPSLAPSCLPSIVPTINPSIKPSVAPSVRPSVHPTTLEFYHSHRKASLPSNKTVSVLGSTDVSFKIVLPLGVTPSGRDSQSFSDVVVTAGVKGTASVYFGTLLTLVEAAAANDTGVYLRFYSHDSAKRSVSVLRDVNADGYDDLMIGDPFASKCYVLFGNSEGLRNMSRGFTIFGEVASDLTGWSVSGAGDVNNDTIDDMIVGAPFARGVGAFYVIYGRADKIFDVYLSNMSVNEGFAVYGSQKSDYLGISVSNAGDVNKDGVDDVVAGALLATSLFSGGVFVVLGNQVYSHSAAVVESAHIQAFGEPYSYAGCSVAGVGDVNGDGYDDVAIGTSSQRIESVAASFVVFGCQLMKTRQLYSMISGDGIKIAGQGSFVSYVGDVNHDGLNDVFVGSIDNTESDVGFIVHTNVSHLYHLTSRPSWRPTVRPTTRSPTFTVTSVPSVTLAPTVTVTVTVTVAPTQPTVQSSFRPTQPTSFPSSEPSAPTVVPSRRPTVSFVPSEVPTFHPTVPITEDPSVTPSIKPTPAPSTHRPTIKTRNPVVMPSQLPTIVTMSPTAAPFSEYYMNEPNSEYNVSNGGNHFIVNTTGHVTIVGTSIGPRKYTILTTGNCSLTIEQFNKSIDLIDITAFQYIAQFQQLQITEGSVLIALSNDVVVHILNLHVADMSAKNFIFYEGVNEPELTQNQLRAIRVLSGVAAGVVGLIVLYFIRKIIIKIQNKNKKPLEHKLFVIVRTNLEGHLVDEWNNDIEKSIPLLLVDNHLDDCEESTSGYHTGSLPTSSGVVESTNDAVVLARSSIVYLSMDSLEYNNTEVYEVIRSIANEQDFVHANKEVEDESASLEIIPLKVKDDSSSVYSENLSDFTLSSDSLHLKVVEELLLTDNVVIVSTTSAQQRSVSDISLFESVESSSENDSDLNTVDDSDIDFDENDDEDVFNDNDDDEEYSDILSVSVETR